MANENPIYLTITKEQLSTLPTVNFNGEIIVCDALPMALDAIDFLNTQQIVGFDTETRPSFKKGHMNSVALIQLSTAGQCFLFRLNKLGFIPQLIRFLENHAVKKIGLSIKDDFIVLHRIAEFLPGGFVELQSYVRNFHIADSSLQKIYGIIFNQRISKNQRLSNWEADTLSPGQQAYASIDAWACLRIYNYLEAGRFDPRASRYLHHEEEKTDQPTDE